MIVIDLYPIAIRVGEIDLFDAIDPEGWLIGFTLPALEGDVVLTQAGHKFVDRGNAEAEVGVLIVGDDFLCS